jgi:hypothetical protein
MELDLCIVELVSKLLNSQCDDSQRLTEALAESAKPLNVVWRGSAFWGLVVIVQTLNPSRSDEKAQSAPGVKNLIPELVGLL